MKNIYSLTFWAQVRLLRVLHRLQWPPTKHNIAFFLMWIRNNKVRNVVTTVTTQQNVLLRIFNSVDTRGRPKCRFSTTATGNSSGSDNSSSWTGTYRGSSPITGHLEETVLYSVQRCYQDQGVRDQDQTKTRQAENETKTREAETKTSKSGLDRSRDQDQVSRYVRNVVV